MSGCTAPFTVRRLFRLLQQIMGPKLRSYVVAFAIGSVVYMSPLIAPFVVGRVVDLLATRAPGDSLEPLYWWCASLTLLMGTAAIIRINSKRILGELCLYAGYNARVLGFERLMDRSFSWHQEESTGSKVQRITNGSSGLQGLLWMAHTDLLNVATTFVGVMACLIYFSPFFAAYSLAYLTLFFLIHFYYIRREKAVLEKSKQAAESASGAYVEGTSNILTIKTLKLERCVAKSVNTKEREAFELNKEANRLNLAKWLRYQLLASVALGGFVLLVAQDVLAGNTTTGALFTLFIYFQNLRDAASMSTDFMDRLLNHWVSIERMAPIFEEGGGARDGQASFPVEWQTIELRGVHSQYAGGRGGLNDLSLSLRRGEHVGVIGRSGAGKSSLAKLLLGVQPVQSGSYTVGGVAFESISTAGVSSGISMVLQDSELFQMSLAENVAAMRDVSAEALERAVRVSCLEEVIEKLPQGLDTLIGEKGFRLSGGERQRVGIARAICKDPGIIVLDEATSALDGKTEERIHAALAQELGDKTLVIIAHRLSTLRHVDRIVVMEDGRIVDEGPPDEILPRADKLLASGAREKIRVGEVQ